MFKGENLKRTAAIGAASWMSFGAQVTLLFLMPILLVSQRLLDLDSLAFTMIMNIGCCSAPARRPGWPARRRGGLTVAIAAVLGCISAICFARSPTRPR